MTGWLGVLAAAEFAMAGLIVAHAAPSAAAQSVVLYVALPAKYHDRLHPPGWTMPAPDWRTVEVTL